MPLPNIKGAYMADLSELVDSESDNVSLTGKDKEKVIEKLKILNSKNFTIIAFGDKAFDFIRKKFGSPKEESHKIPFSYIDKNKEKVNAEGNIREIEINDISAKVFRVRHYSNWDLKSKALFKLQLKYLNDKALK
jgi:hypothetical protein